MKNNLYALGFFAAITLHRCGTEADVYTGQVDGTSARYEVTEAGTCILELKYFPMSLIEGEHYINPTEEYIRDYDCDNFVDAVDSYINPQVAEHYNRETLENMKTVNGMYTVELYDALLRQGRKLVKPENKVGP